MFAAIQGLRHVKGQLRGELQYSEIENYLVKKSTVSELQVDGTMKYEDAIDQRGEVYSRIKPGETGEVSVVVDGTMRTLKGRGKDKTALLNTGDFIRVIDVIGSTLIVVSLDVEEEAKTEEE